MHIEIAHALRYVDVKRIHIGRIALPLHRLAVGRDGQAGELVDRAAGLVVTRNPGRVEQGHLAGADRNGFVHIENAVCQIGGVHVQLDRARIGHVLRRRNAELVRRRLRTCTGKHGGRSPEGRGNDCRSN
jgi:hypothetical protein